MKKELLAPAGDIEAGYAALYYGADAVYLGLKNFSARATAANFGEQELNEFVAFAHHLNRKVYAAINTLVQEHELPQLLQTLDLCSKYHVDGVIIQDLGVARIIHEQYPELEMHASTQMAVHNKEGALALQKIGFTRVVLARELHLSEIKEIASIPNLETEAFIHGALCYSYSGLCLFSSFETGKSANRGKCLYPCRASFDGEAGKKHYFSMKDMALQEKILDMPVTSLKIEGRKKTALYVAAVTDYYRRILDGKGADSVREEHIKQIFSRPWTDFHFKGKNKNVIDRDFVGHRGLLIGKIEKIAKNKLFFKTNHKIARYDGIQIDVNGDEKPFGFSLQFLKVNGKNVFEAEKNTLVEISLPPKTPELSLGENIYLASSSEVKGAYPYTKPKPKEFMRRDEVKVEVKVSPTEITATANGISAKVSGEFAPAQNPDQVKSAIETAFGKTGDTNFTLGGISIDNPSNLFAPASLLNELRRNLYAQISIEDKHGSIPEISAPRVQQSPQWVIKTDDLASLSQINLDEVAEVIWLISPNSKAEELKTLPKNKVRIALPAVCRKPQLYAKLIAELLAQGYKKWEIGHYWGLSVLPEKGIDISFDASIYTLNTQAIEQAKEMDASRVTLALEDDLANMQALADISQLPLSMVVYQDTPLFTSADCIRSNDCKNCPQGEKWLNLKRDGKSYQALSKDCQIMLFSENPYCVAQEVKNIKADFYRADFCYKKYTADKVLKIFSKLTKFQDIPPCIKANVARNGLM